MTTKPSKTAVTFREELAKELTLKILIGSNDLRYSGDTPYERGTAIAKKIIDTHLAALMPRLAEVLVKDPKIADVLLGDVESNGEAVCFTGKTTAIKGLTAALERGYKEIKE